MDLTIIAIPGFFASMGYEARWLQRRAQAEGPSPVDYERNDTIASLSMGVGSLVVPLVASRFARNFALGSGRWAKPLLGVAGAAVATTVVADAVRRAYDQEPGQVPSDATAAGSSTATDAVRSGAGPAEAGSGDRRRRRAWARRAKQIAGSSAVAAIAAGGFAAASTWAARTSAKRLFPHRVLPDLGGGPLALGAAVLGWDFIYYWNHRLQHESRIMWAIHVVHHSSERYNLSTALRQPWADSLGMFVPYGLMSLLGIRPNLIETARQINLIYQYWIHTDAIRSIGPLESVLNTASHHRVHHGMNRQYLDRNHGSILIVWDKLFGTFEPEDEPVRYGLTKNIDTFNPLRIATHEHAEIVRDVAGADNWHDRLSFVLRGPGWAYSRHPARPGGEAPHAEVIDAELATA
jgi:sterol desaturase/sphingolipid hydroxylase (fatty acid hydroxylase superfamily)